MQQTRKTPLIYRILCLILVFCMVPVFKFDAGAAKTANEEYQYVWLVSKPGIYYDNYYENGKHIFQCYSSKNKSEKWQLYYDGSYCYSRFKNGEGLRVYTDFTNETTPDIAEWGGTKFVYNKRIATYDTAIEEAEGNETYHWAGNAKGGSACTVKDGDRGATFAGNNTSSHSAASLQSLSSGGNWYNITFKIAKDALKNGKGIPYSNVSCFLYKSVKKLPNISGGGSGGGGGTDPDPEPEETTASADLSIKANDVSVNYKKFSVEGKGETSVTFDPTDSSTNADWTKYVLSGSDDQGWKMNETYDGRPRKKSFSIEFTKESLRYKGGLGSATVDVRGSVKVYADGDGDRKSVV